MTELAERPTELDTTDKEAAYLQVLKAMRGGNKQAAFEAFRVWAEMPTPGQSDNEHIARLQEALSFHKGGVTLRPLLLRELLDRIDALAWEWRWAPELQGLNIRKPSIVMDSSGIDPDSVGDVFELHVGMQIVGKHRNTMVVEPSPRRGKRYLLVDADKADRFKSKDHLVEHGHWFDMYKLVCASREWTMHEPATVVRSKRGPLYTYMCTECGRTWSTRQGDALCAGCEREYADKEQTATPSMADCLHCGGTGVDPAGAYRNIGEALIGHACPRCVGLYDA